MNPTDLAKRLRMIAAAIDNSEQPSQAHVAREIEATIRLANGADPDVVKFLQSFDLREPLVHELIMAFNEADERFLEDEGYSNLSALEADDSDKGKEVLKRWELLRRQTELFQNCLRSVQQEVAAIDLELYGDM